MRGSPSHEFLNKFFFFFLYMKKNRGGFVQVRGANKK